MVHENIHIICGNCGQDLTEKDMATWKYIPKEIDAETGEIYNTSDVYIYCENCATIHLLKNHIKEQTNDNELRED